MSTLYSKQNTSLEDNFKSLNDTKTSLNTPQTFMKDGKLEYVIDRLVAHEKTPKQTLYQVRWYGYDPADDTLVPEANNFRHFITSYCCSKTERT